MKIRKGFCMGERNTKRKKNLVRRKTIVCVGTLWSSCYRYTQKLCNNEFIHTQIHNAYFGIPWPYVVAINGFGYCFNAFDCAYGETRAHLHIEDNTLDLAKGRKIGQQQSNLYIHIVERWKRGGTYYSYLESILKAFRKHSESIWTVFGYIRMHSDYKIK